MGEFMVFHNWQIQKIIKTSIIGLKRINDNPFKLKINCLIYTENNERKTNMLQRFGHEHT